MLIAMTLLVLGVCAAQDTPVKENTCIVQQLSSEVLHQLLADTNATLRHMQEVKLLLGSHQRLDVPEGTDALASGGSTALLLLLLNNLETEQTRQSKEIERLNEQVRALSGHSTNGPNNQQYGAPIGSLLLAVQQLQQEVRQLGSPYSVPIHNDTLVQLQQPLQQSNNCIIHGSDRPRDCYDLLEAGKNQSGIYQIFPLRCERHDEGIQVWCDMESKGGGWTVILSRQPLVQQINFNRGWRDYRKGFGDPHTEYWIGNRVLHDLTSGQTQMLRVELGDWDGEKRWAEYQVFLVEDEDSEYRLHVAQFSGNAGNALVIHDNMRFTTSDRDNDSHESINCAVMYHGGFWFEKCHTASPTSLLLEKQKSTKGINWNTWYPDRTTLKNVTFKIRPNACHYM